MKKLIQGIQHFQTNVFRSKRDLFATLAGGQKPAALFITCADSRVNPNLFTHTEPGDIFVLRNAGNIIPPAPFQGGEIATIEFALEGLGIQDIVVCGHSDCGAMKALIGPQVDDDRMPAVKEWLGHASRTAEISEACHRHLPGPQRLTATVEENVLVQIENLRSHPFIEERLAKGELNLHGWVYEFETGQVLSFDPTTEEFLPLQSGDPRPVYPRELKVAKVVGLES